MSRERIEKQLRKTGNTEFEFSFLKAEIGEKVFLPMQSLNELRREALETLEKVISHTRYKLTPAELEAFNSAVDNRLAELTANFTSACWLQSCHLSVR